MFMASACNCCCAPGGGTEITGTMWFGMYHTFGLLSKFPSLDHNK